MCFCIKHGPSVSYTRGPGGVPCDAIRLPENLTRCDVSVEWLWKGQFD